MPLQLVNATTFRSESVSHAATYALIPTVARVSALPGDNRHPKMACTLHDYQPFSCTSSLKHIKQFKSKVCKHS